MNVKTCRKCRRLFNYVMGPWLCVNCREEEEEKFQEVKKYVMEHGRCSMQEVSEACEVTMSQIKQWLREERLVLSDDSPMGIGCEKCGKSIKGGRFCNECLTEITSSLKNASNSMKKDIPGPEPKKNNRDGDKMRFLNK